MIGEIRDQDTARTALQSALTGHLVMSTFHAYSAAAALTRMLDAVGINPLFASAIHLVMAQRLVRRLDDKTKQAYQPDEALKKQLAKANDDGSRAGFYAFCQDAQRSLHHQQRARQWRRASG